MHCKKMLGNSADGLDRLIWYAAAPDPLHEQHGDYPPVPNFAIIRYSRKVCGQMEQVCEIPQHRDVYINHNDAVPLLLLPHSYLHPIQHIPACNAVISGSVPAALYRVCNPHELSCTYVEDPFMPSVG